MPSASPSPGERFVETAALRPERREILPSWGVLLRLDHTGVCMSDRTVRLSAERYERLRGLAAARGRTVEEQVAVLVDDACAGAGDAPAASDLPLGVCDDAE